MSKRLSSLIDQIYDKNSVVVEVGDDGFAVRPEADTTRRVEMLPHGAVQSVLQQEFAGGWEELWISNSSKFKDPSALHKQHSHVN
jgi:hypothetical protein